MKKKNMVLLLIAVLCIGIIGSVLIYTYSFVERKFEIDMHATVDKVIGFNVGTDKVWFGSVPPGQRSDRAVIIKGNPDHPVKVVFKVSGPISKYVTVQDNGFILQPGQNRNITLQFTAPENYTLGENITGKLYTTIYKRWW